MESNNKLDDIMDIEDSSNTTKNNQNNNQSQHQQKPIIQLDPKALEKMKEFAKKLDIKEYNYNDDILYLPKRYKPGELIGSGAYGNILSAVDTENNNQVVAIKKLKSISDIIDLKRVAV